MQTPEPAQPIDVDSNEVISPDMSLYCEEDDQYDNYYDAAVPNPRLSAKRPRYIDLVDDDDQPDLDEYFSNWNMGAKDIIIMCRSYASYLAAKNKSKTK